MGFRESIREYWPLAGYVLRKFGWKSMKNFWYTILCVADEGGEYELNGYFYRAFPGLLRRPAKIEIEHTTVCNKRCWFCAHTHWNVQPQQMSFDQFRRIVDDLTGLKWLNIAGIGSNFLNRDFIRILQYTRNKHLNVNFVDEFDLFDESAARMVIEMGIHSIYVSFDAATKETYQKIKSRSDSTGCCGISAPCCD